MDIHDAAAKGFNRGGDAYERGRPEFPKDAIDFLVEALAVGSSSRVIDLGAGTGKLTRALVPSGARLTAVEPVEGMRKKFASFLPGVEVFKGTAESMPLPEGSADAVVVGQAFHWFQGEEALQEIHRVLKPGGKLGLVWNVRDESLDWVAGLSRIINVFKADAPRYGTFEWKKPFDRTTLFTPLEKQIFPFLQKGGAEMVVDRALSVSFISALPEKDREGVAHQVRELLASHPQTRGKTEFEIPYRTEIYWCQRKP